MRCELRTRQTDALVKVWKKEEKSAPVRHAHV